MKYPEFKDLTVNGIAVVISEIAHIALSNNMSGDFETQQKLLQAQAHLTLARSLLNEYMIEEAD
jgi:hypothetical protein